MLNYKLGETSIWEVIVEMNLKENYLLGIDLGTTNVKGNIMDAEGNLIATACDGGGYCGAIGRDGCCGRLGGGF